MKKKKEDKDNFLVLKLTCRFPSIKCPHCLKIFVLLYIIADTVGTSNDYLIQDSVNYCPYCGEMQKE